MKKTPIKWQFYFFLLNALALSLAQKEILQEGEINFQAKRYQEAINNFSEVLKRTGWNENIAKANLRMGQCYFALGNPKQARKYFSRASRWKGEIGTSGFLGLAMCDIEEGKYDSAIESLTSLIGQKPPRDILAYAYYNRGIAFEKKGWLIKALQDYQEALTLGSKDEALLSSAKARLLTVQSIYEQFKKEEQVFSLKIKEVSTPDLARDLYHEMARKYAEIGEVEKAIDCEMRSLNYSTDPNYNAGAWMNIAWRYFLIRNYDKAADAFKKVANDYPQSQFTTEALLRAGDMYSYAKKLDEAIAAYQEFIEKFPGDTRVPSALANIAWRYSEKGDCEKAAQLFFKINAEFPDSIEGTEALLYAGDMLARLGKTEEAIKIYQEFLQKYPNNPKCPYALMSIAWRYAELKDYDKAALFFKKTAENFPQAECAPEALIRAGDMLSSLGKNEEAMKFYERFIKLFPDDEKVPAVMINIAWLHFAQRHYTEAAEWFKKVVDEYPFTKESKEALFSLGDMYSLLGRNEEAIKVYEDFILRYPSDEKANSALMNIAWRYRAGRNLPKEREILKRLNESLPDSELKWYTLALYYEDGEQYKEALDAYSKVLNYNGDYRFLSLIGTAVCAYFAKDYEIVLQAVKYAITDYLDIEPMAVAELLDFQALSYLALNYDEEKDRSITVSLLKERAEKYPHTPKGADASLAIIDIYFLTGLEQLGYEEYEKLVSNYKNTSPEIVTAALEVITPYLYSIGGKEKVMNEYTKLKDILTSSTLLWLSSFFGEMGDMQGTIDVLQGIVKQYPESEDSVVALIEEGKCFCYSGKKDRAKESFQKARNAKCGSFASATASFWLTLLENSTP
ncbi:tetratricopeptide repeat protein [bacterium]|nr:tetratricopeptide repeat protein [bacterium]